MRSYLFVPGDAPAKMDKALATAADALILDLEDAVSPAGKEAGRQAVRSFLDRAMGEADRPRLFVRINALDTPLHAEDLRLVMEARPDGIVLPKAEGGASLVRLSLLLDEAEAKHGWEPGSTSILPIATETALGVLAMPSLPGASERLHGVTWGGEDLAADLGAETNRNEGIYTGPYQHARTMTLLTASAARVDAIDAVYTTFRDEAGLRTECEIARCDGFQGKLAIHPGQVTIINEVFSPSQAAVADAREVIEAMAGAASGIATLRGRMLDKPHLRQAERVLARASSARRPVRTG